jgi:hypothetical protein
VSSRSRYDFARVSDGFLLDCPPRLFRSPEHARSHRLGPSRRRSPFIARFVVQIDPSAVLIQSYRHHLSIGRSVTIAGDIVQSAHPFFEMAVLEVLMHGVVNIRRPMRDVFAERVEVIPEHHHG